MVGFLVGLTAAVRHGRGAKGKKSNAIKFVSFLKDDDAEHLRGRGGAEPQKKANKTQNHAGRNDRRKQEGRNGRQRPTGTAAQAKQTGRSGGRGGKATARAGGARGDRPGPRPAVGGVRGAEKPPA